MKKAILISVATIMVLGCMGGGSNTGPSGGGNWLPIAVGNFWEYILTGTAQYSGVVYTCQGNAFMEILGTATHDDGFQLYTYEMEETLIYLLGGVPYDTIYTWGEGYFRVESDGIYEYTSLSDSIGYLFLQLPLADGDTWIPSSDDPYGLYEVLSVTADINVPNGSYTGCAEVKYTNSHGPGYFATDYYAPGVGLGEKYISIEDTGDTDYLIYSWELSDTN